jgi:hypothetical protein
MDDMTTKHNNEITSNRNQIQNMVETLKGEVAAGNLQDAVCPVTNRFAPGCYIREVFMPAGSKVIGKIHTTEHFNILIKGKITVLTAEGSEYMEAPHTFVSKAGVQKVGFIHEDCIWQTIHVTNSTDVDEIEKEMVVACYDELLIDDLLSQGLGVLK